MKVLGNVELGGNLICPSACVPAASLSGKVNDSDKLDGIDSADFVRGGGAADGQAIARGRGDNFLGPVFAGSCDSSTSARRPSGATAR